MPINNILDDALTSLRTSGYAQIAVLLEEEINQKDRALDAGIRALDKLSTKGSITRVLRETAMEKMWNARQMTLIPDERPLLESARL